MLPIMKRKSGSWENFSSNSLPNSIASSYSPSLISFLNFLLIFRFSKLSGLIDDVDTSISSNKTSIGVRQHKTVTAEQLSTSFDVYSDQTHYEYTVGGAIEIIFDGIDLKSPVNAGTFKSDTFTTLGRILKETKDTIQTVYYQDDGLGNIDLLVGGGNLFEKGVGTID